MKSLRFFPLAAICISLLTGCKTAGTGAGNGGPDSDYVTGSPLGTPLPDRNEGASFLGSNVNRDKFPPVFFGFDSSLPGSAEMAKLDAVAEFARSSGSSIIIAGFTDERGTPEYNRGLGERRALTVREELIRLGVNGGQLQTVSFGEDMPLSNGGDESSWARNRRAEFGVVQ